MHTGYCRTTASPLLPTITELRATIRVLPPQNCKSPAENLALKMLLLGNKACSTYGIMF